MSLSSSVDRLQIVALVVAAIFVLFLFTGFPGAGDGVPADISTPDVSVPTDTDTSEPAPADSPGSGGSAPDTSGPDGSTPSPDESVPTTASP